MMWNLHVVIQQQFWIKEYDILSDQWVKELMVGSVSIPRTPTGKTVVDMSTKVHPVVTSLTQRGLLWTCPTQFCQ